MATSTGINIFLILVSLSCIVWTKPMRQPSIAFDEMSHFLEADILPDKDVSKMAVLDNLRLWPGGIMAYKLDFEVDQQVYVTNVILAAIHKINEVGCVSIVEAGGNPPPQDYVVIKLGQNYSSHVGHQEGPQDLTVVGASIDVGSVMHELMHALGLGHEHNRPDRDQYVTVDFSNIKEEAKQYFTIYGSGSGFVGDDLAYDYTSIMHATSVYDPSINVDMTKPVIWRNDGGQELGQRYKLTELDMQRLREAYSCQVCETPDHDGMYYRYPGDCTKLYQCSNTVAYIQNCPAGLHFSRSLFVCDYPSHANCTSVNRS